MHADLEQGLSHAWASHRSDVGSTWQIHESRHTIEFAWYHPQTGEFMVAAEYSIRSGDCVAVFYSLNEAEIFGDGVG